MSPTVSVLIAQWGKTDFTDRCVTALQETVYEGDLEILIYDNASPDGPGPVEERSDITLIRGEVNIGFGPAQNLMAEEASGDLLLILNNDTIVTPTAISRMVGTMEDPSVGAVSPRYLGFDGRTLELGGFVGKGAEGWQLFRGEAIPPSLSNMEIDADYGSAACLLLRRDQFLELGGFDDLFAPAYYEDTDLCFKLTSEGKRVVVNPRAVVYHYEGATAGKEVTSGLKKLQADHQVVFSERWADRLAGEAPASMNAAIAKILRLDRHAVLWVSPELPRPDHEAGHARLLAMLRELKRAGSSVVVWAEMAAEWRRYGPLLEQEGIPWFAHRESGRVTPRREARYSTLQELLEIGGWDVVAVSFPEMAQRFLPEIRRISPSVPVVVDAVDLHFLRLERDPGTSDAEAEEVRTKELDLYRTVEGVTTAGDHETDELEHLVPGTPARAFASVATIEIADEPLSAAEGEVMFLGNFNHGPNAAGVDFWVDEIVPRMAQPVVLGVHGSGAERFLERWPTELVRVHGWAPDLEEVFSGARLFAAPLTFGAGTKGKLLEAAAAGVPVVTTGIGAEGYHGPLLESFTVEDDPQAYADAVSRLVEDDDVWQSARTRTIEGARAWSRNAAIAQSEWAAWVRRRRGG